MSSRLSRLGLFHGSLTRTARWVTTTTYLRRWLVLGVAIGAIAGTGAVVFYSLLRLGTSLFLTHLVGFQVPTAHGEGALAGSHEALRAWALPLVVGGGGLLSGLIVFKLAPEAEGHGTDAAIAAVHRNPRGIRARAVAVKIVASAITIGSGGSGGREGPTAQISAGFGSLLARLLNLSPGDARIAVSVGIGSGIGAIFRAPLGGAVLATEILYRDDMEPEALVPALIASIVSYAIFGAAEGYTPMFAAQSHYQFSDPSQLGWFALIGVVCGLMGLLYSSSFHKMAAKFETLRLPRAMRPALGGLAVGCIAVAVPEVLGTGYGWVQEGLFRHGLLALPIVVVVALPFARIAATGLSIGSGGSGGIFGPGMVIGAFTGAAIWRLLEPVAPSIPHSPAPFVIVGMMACFGSICRAPLAVMLIVAEMTASLEMLAPAMLAVGIATLIVRRSDATIYSAQQRTRADSPAHRLQFGMPLLGSVTSSRAMSRPRVVLQVGESAASALGRLYANVVPGAPVVDSAGAFVGTVTSARLSEAASSGAPGTRIDPCIDPTAAGVQSSAALDVALEALTTTPDSFVSVLDSSQHVVGIITVSAIVKGYQGALGANLSRLSSIARGAEPIEVRVGEASPVAGRRLKDARLPTGTVVVTLEGPGGLVFPDGETFIATGDVLSAVVPAEAAAKLRQLLAAVEDREEPLL